jgi:hypothetical protein
VDFYHRRKQYHHCSFIICFSIDIVCLEESKILLASSAKKQQCHTKIDVRNIRVVRQVSAQDASYIRRIHVYFFYCYY